MERSNVLKFFLPERILCLIGPVMLFLTLAVANFRPHLFAFDLWAIAFLGIFILALRPKEGLFLAIGLTVLSSIFHHIQFTSHLWFLGLEVSFIFGFLAFYSSLDLLEEKLSYLFEKNKYLLEQISQRDEEKKKAYESFRKQHHHVEERLSQTEEELEKKKREIAETISLLEVIKKNDLEFESWKKEVLNQLLLKEELIGSLKEKVKILEFQKSSQEKIKTIVKDSETDRLYSQLKDQFEEKKELLHITRSSLFGLQEKLLAKQKEEEWNIQKISEEEKALYQILNSLSEENNKYEDVIDRLEDLLSNLFLKNQHLEVKSVQQSFLTKS